MIPRPALRQSTGEPAELSSGLVIATDELSRDTALLLRAELEAASGWRIDLRDAGASSSHGTIKLRVDGGGPGASLEGYRLQTGPRGVDIVGSGAAGVFYGTRSLLQLLPAAWFRSAPSGAVPSTSVEVAATQIEDQPRFAWRGAHLDVSRHFMPKGFVLRLVDLLALHKMNVLHLHLTDDQGWRFPVDRWPLLTEVGAWRRESSAGHVEEGRFDGVPHGGFYSKADLYEIVAYAARRHVTVMPEIDMPGHMQAAIAAYPELGNTAERLEVRTGWGISEHVLNMDEPTVRFCLDVLEEVLEVFPSTHIHIGGDECPTKEWEASARAMRRVHELGLERARSLQGWFTGRMGEFLADRGRIVVGWDEILDEGAPKDAVIMCWRSQHLGMTAVGAAHDVVMAPQQWLYFDLAYAEDVREPLAIRAATSTERVYRYEPIPEGLAPEDHHRVLGAQCQLWTEYVGDPRHAEYLYFPRACALAEVAWSPRERDWEEFQLRLTAHLSRLDALGVNYRPLEGPNPGQAATWPV
ncbi:MAG TPA: beta-N-acetylhexosaminidase [Acidimicrobiales bacterium]|nr:beta-N-acetylhexosaminidase [Acidimicrobiales bacterium]